MRILPLTVLRALLSKSNWQAFADVVTVETFSATHYRRIFEHLNALHQQTSTDINCAGLLADIETKYRDKQDIIDEYRDVIAQIEATPDVPYGTLRGIVNEFVARELSFQAAKYVIDNQSSKDFDAKIPHKLLEHAVEVGSAVDANVLDFNTAALPGEIHDRPGVIGLGLSPQLDDNLGGGVGAGELLVIIAPPSRGKTSYLCTIGARAARKGRRILHITCEISGRRVITRYDQAATRCTKTDLIRSPQIAKKARETIAEKGGAVWIKDWSHCRVTADDVVALVRRMRQNGQNVDYVIIDYLELLYPAGIANKNRETRHIYGVVAKEIRAAAVMLGVPIVTAWQINREGSEEYIVSTINISESWEVVKWADIIISLNQTPAEVSDKIMRIGILKQRDDIRRGIIYLHSDLSNMDIQQADLMPKEDAEIEFTGTDVAPTKI